MRWKGRLFGTIAVMWTDQHKSDKSVVVNGSEKNTKATMNRITNGRSKQLGNIRHFRLIFGGGGDSIAILLL